MSADREWHTGGYIPGPAQAFEREPGEEVVPAAEVREGVREALDQLNGESTSARLRRVEAERDELRIRLTNEHQSTLALLDRRNVELRLERDAQVQLRRRLISAEAELASARTELEKLRAQLARRSA